MSASNFHVGASRKSDCHAAIKQAIVAAAKDNSPINCVGFVPNRSSMLELMAHMRSPTQV